MSNFLAKNLKKAREKRGLTQEQLASKLSISTSTVGMYEQGRRQPDIKTLIKLSNELNIPISVLLETKDELNIESIQIDKAILELIDFMQN